ncbi:cytochrome c biogenesis protein CcsA [Engelhardtia mirabilis]|uniref:Cytochrome C assembly protein n=1 Tax=Engelhardtia mirabilis TaxID=2528011 RepID=A0A518BSV1_9BACT|nr:Cytochrome C assembly protein [Planctomycetes bacterium Pla133]QDV04375.1 Cytochrome C assembly protein [Planctomycetes bacterium Pla86]
MIQALSTLLPVAYLTATFLYLLDFLVERQAVLWRVRLVALVGVLGLHVGLIAARAVAAGGFPHLGGWSALSALALCLVTLHLWTTARAVHPGTSLIVFGVATLLQLVSSALSPVVTALADDRPLPFYLFHVGSILVASAALVLSGLYGLLYLALFRQMRRRRFGPLFSGLPSLDQIIHVTRRAALAAFVLLAIGVNAGIWWAHRAQVEGFSYADPLVLALLVLTLHFGLVAFSGRIPGLTARRASVAAAAGFMLLLISLVAVQLSRASFHWTS